MIRLLTFKLGVVGSAVDITPPVCDFAKLTLRDTRLHTVYKHYIPTYEIQHIVAKYTL